MYVEVDEVLVLERGGEGRRRVGGRRGGKKEEWRDKRVEEKEGRRGECGVLVVVVLIKFGVLLLYRGDMLGLYWYEIGDTIGII